MEAPAAGKEEPTHLTSASGHSPRMCGACDRQFWEFPHSFAGSHLRNALFYLSVPSKRRNQVGLGGEGAANAEFLGNPDPSRKPISRHLSTFGGLFSLLANRIGGTAAPIHILLFFPASASLPSPGFFLLLNSSPPPDSCPKSGPSFGDLRG